MGEKQSSGNQVGSMGELQWTSRRVFTSSHGGRTSWIREDLQENKWTRGLMRMTNAEEISEFINLWGLVEHVVLGDQPDTITWLWTVSGEYTSKSAYDIQFQGS